MLAKTSKELRFSNSQMAIFQQIRDMVEREIESSRDNATGVRKLLTILMQYPDKPFVKTQEDFHHLFNQIKYTEQGAFGSVKDFYLEASYNKLDVQTTVVGPFTAQNNHAYYGNGDARDLAHEAVLAAKASGVNFAEFAIGTNVPNFYMIFAGHGQEAGGGANCIWSHAWSLKQAIYFDGVRISSYACSPELRGGSGRNITRIGVICHELGHSFGELDYYDTNYATGGQYDGTGNWDLMASGSWNDGGRTPALPNPRSKVYIYGWANATELDNAQTVTIPSARIYDNAYFRINTQTPNEYYILENKIRGGFDNSIPGANMLIYHCAANVHTGGNTINTTSPQKFYPVAANAPVDLPSTGSNAQADYGTINSGLCSWPGNTGKTEFSDTVVPAMLSWSRLPTNKPITNIAVHSDYITFDFMGGGEKSNFNVFIPNYYGCTITAQSTSPVDAGGSFSFTVNKLPSHSNSNLKVSANDTELTPSGNLYTISDIQADQIIKIEDLTFNTLPIIATTDKNGSISPVGVVYVNHGGLQIFELTPYNGCSVDKIIVDGVDVGNGNSYTFTNITEPHTINAIFKLGGIYTIDVSHDAINFYTTDGVPSKNVEVTVSSSDVIANITVEMPPKFQIFNNGTWSQSMVIQNTQLPLKIYLRFNPSVGDEGITEDIAAFKSTEAYAQIRLGGYINLGINDAHNEQNIVIYPNPTMGQLTIRNYELGITDVEIFDVYGRKLSSNHHIISSSHQKIDISHLSAGIYFVKVKTETGEVTQKVIKN
jgi:M6 family metalloprotease-like protein